ncbi:keratin-associated protein 5-10-like [Molothrus aeneus]|uniref:keratin-associated protein 5-10-like n=1 Tax=Molothrus aeneus TaxID=84833 RepID=UPI00345B22F8
MIYSSGRESFFNLNSTWYDPSGSWLDTRRTPFRYGYSTCCSSGSSSGCHGEGVEGMRGHDYRHYGYRQPRCAERCHGYSSSCHGAGDSCVRRPTYSYGASGGCQGYGRSVCAERCQGYGRSVCAERCQGSSGSCHGGGSSCVRRPTYSYGGSGGCQGYGRSVCSERCHGTVAQGGKPCCGTPVQSIPACPPPVQACPCPPPVQQGCVPMAKGIPRQQQKQVCKMPARKIK